MAGEDRRQTPAVKKRLLEEGERFSFTQALRLLRYIISRENGGIGGYDEISRRIRVRPYLSLDFPESDITKIEELPGDHPLYRITATFLGLYGASSPLPTFYTEDLLYEQSDDVAITRDFIDIFNFPAFNLFFKCWKKYRLFYTIVEEPDADVVQRLYCLIGLEGAQLRRKVDDAAGMLRYIGLLTQFPRCAEGLRSLLVDSVDEPSISIDQCVPRVTAIPEDQRCAVGKSGHRLGENSYLGFEIADRMGKFRILAGPLDSGSFHRFLPDRPAFRKMIRMTRFYLDQPLACDFELRIDSDDIETARLGSETWSQLGWNTWIFSEKFYSGTLSVTLPERAH